MVPGLGWVHVPGNHCGLRPGAPGKGYNLGLVLKQGVVRDLQGWGLPFCPAMEQLKALENLTCKRTIMVDFNGYCM